MVLTDGHAWLLWADKSGATGTVDSARCVLALILGSPADNTVTRADPGQTTSCDLEQAPTQVAAWAVLSLRRQSCSQHLRQGQPVGISALGNLGAAGETVGQYDRAVSR